MARLDTSKINQSPKACSELPSNEGYSSVIPSSQVADDVTLCTQKYDSSLIALAWTQHEVVHGCSAQVLANEDADVDLPDYQGRTAVIHAALIGRPDLVQLLASCSADLDMTDNVLQQSALAHASAAGHLEALRNLQY